jgi:calreticulin
LLVLLSALAAVALSEVFLKEEFADGEAWTDRWINSKHKSDNGEFKLTAGKFYGDAEKDKGLQTSADAKFYATSRKFDKTMATNEGKTLVIQFTVKHEQNIDCGGGYVKIMSDETDLETVHGETPYHIMFGPDICGPGTKKVHVIFTYKGKNHLIKKDIRCKDDEFTHVYTLILTPDNKYEVLIDNEKAESGELESDWDMLPERKVKDPDAKKPEEWDDNEYIDDPEDTKPEDWDKAEHVADPEAKKPEDWDDEMDGEWEPPMIDNPEYKGEWKPKQIKNEAYKGAWVHPEIDNPDYSPDDKLYAFKNIGAVALDLWQVKSGTIFDNFLVTDDVAEAKAHAEETWGVTKEAEKKMKESQDEVEKKKMEEEEKKRKEEEDANKKDGDDEEEEEADKEDEADHDEL